MNTGEVAKLLGVSASTIQRWVKQLGLSMERNDRGHYIFNEENIEILKEIQTQIQHGILMQEIAASHEKKQSKEVPTVNQKNRLAENLASKISELEYKLNDKADSVVSYQLLQHRREIDDLQNQLNLLLQKVQSLEATNQKANVVDELLTDMNVKPKKKKKNLFRSLFGFL